jgi:ribokinase
MRLTVIGSANVDLTFRIPQTPRPGVTEVCREYFLGFGGKGANQAVQAARLGARVAFIGKVGEDPFGPATVEQLRREGIETAHVTTATGRLTGTAVILLDPSGQNTIITHAGPNVALTATDVERASEIIASSDILLMTLEVPAEPAFTALRIARNAGVRTILNPAPPVDFPHEMLKLVDIALPNESELVALTGLRAGSLQELRASANALRQKGPGAVVVTLGERGAYLLDGQLEELIPAHQVKAVDTSGAGDAFSAGFAVALGEGASLGEAARHGNSVAALSVTRVGTQSSFPRRDELAARFGGA